VKKLFLSVFLISSTLFSLQVSVIIPCHASHARRLLGLLDALSAQTLIPNKVVISVSETNNDSEAISTMLRLLSWPFDLKVVTSERVQFPGENRNIAASHIDDGIVVLQDADDIPHPQRLEIIHYFFDKYGCDHLMHNWIRSKRAYSLLQKRFKKDKISFLFFYYYDQLGFNRFFGKYMHLQNGNIAVKRSVLDYHHWSEKPEHRYGDDVLFNQEIYKDPELKKIVIDCPVFIYQKELSTFDTKFH